MNFVTSGSDHILNKLNESDSSVFLKCNLCVYNSVINTFTSIILVMGRLKILISAHNSALSTLSYFLLYMSEIERGNYVIFISTLFLNCFFHLIAQVISLK